MTIYHRLRVWMYKGFRIVTNAFKFTRSRTVNAIWMLPVFGECDYCGNDKQCATLEGDYETVVQICGSCLQKAMDVLQQAPAVQKDHRGVIM